MVIPCYKVLVSVFINAIRTHGNTQLALPDRALICLLRRLAPVTLPKAPDQDSAAYRCPVLFAMRVLALLALLAPVSAFVAPASARPEVQSELARPLASYAPEPWLKQFAQGLSCFLEPVTQ